MLTVLTSLTLSAIHFLCSIKQFPRVMQNNVSLFAVCYRQFYQQVITSFLFIYFATKVSQVHLSHRLGKMKVVTCEIAWHNKEPVYSLDFQHSSDGRFHRLATAGVDTTVRVSGQGSTSASCFVFLQEPCMFSLLHMETTPEPCVICILVFLFLLFAQNKHKIITIKINSQVRLEKLRGNI